MPVWDNALVKGILGLLQTVPPLGSNTVQNLVYIVVNSCLLRQESPSSLRDSCVTLLSVIIAKYRIAIEAAETTVKVGLHHALQSYMKINGSSVQANSAITALESIFCP